MTTRVPQFGEVMEQAFGSSLGRLRAVDVGEVTAWNRTQQWADVRPTILNADGSARATVPRCAVVFPGAYWDLETGETGLLLVCDRDYHRWWRTGEDSVPLTTGNHVIGNSVFLPGLRSSTDERELAGDSVVLPRSTTGGTVRLGTYDATKAAVHEDLLSALDGLLTDLSTWVTAVDAAAGTSGALLQAEITAVKAGITAGSYQSPSVKVED